MSNNLDDVLTLKQVGEILKCSSKHVGGLIARGELEAKLISLASKKHYRVTRAMLNKYLETPSVIEPTLAKLPARKELLVTKRHMNLRR